MNPYLYAGVSVLQFVLGAVAHLLYVRAAPVLRAVWQLYASKKRAAYVDSLLKGAPLHTVASPAVHQIDLSQFTVDAPVPPPPPAPQS